MNDLLTLHLLLFRLDLPPSHLLIVYLLLPTSVTLYLLFATSFCPFNEEYLYPFIFYVTEGVYPESWRFLTGTISIQGNNITGDNYPFCACIEVSYLSIRFFFLKGFTVASDAVILQDVSQYVGSKVYPAWTSSGDPCLDRWGGVTCSANGYVSQIDLHSTPLSGILSNRYLSFIHGLFLGLFCIIDSLM